MRMAAWYCMVPGEDLLSSNVPMHIGQAAVDAVVVEAELFVVQPEPVQRGGVEVVAMRRVHGGL